MCRKGYLYVGFRPASSGGGGRIALAMIGAQWGRMECD